jgi:hypothetical protein
MHARQDIAAITVRAAELFPVYQFTSASDAFGDPGFVFGVDKP